MPQYAYISLSQAGNLPDPDGYPIRLAVYVAGFTPDLTDSNGHGIPNILELDVPEFTDTQKADIAALGGQWFADAESYLNWKSSLIE